MERTNFLGPKIRIAIAAAVCCVAVTVAYADSINTFAFSGSLANNNGLVTGTFTLDQTNSTITAFDMKTPVMELNSANFTQTGAFVFTFTPAISPNTNLVIFEFLDVFFDHTILVFAADIGTFNGSGFLTTPVTIPTGTGSSEVVCGGSGSPLCSVGGFQSTFRSGSAKLVPEPGTLSFVLSGLIGLACRKLMQQRSKT